MIELLTLLFSLTVSTCGTGVDVGLGDRVVHVDEHMRYAYPIQTCPDTVYDDLTPRPTLEYTPMDIDPNSVYPSTITW